MDDERGFGRVLPDNARRRSRFAVFAALFCLAGVGLLTTAGSGMAAESTDKEALKRAVAREMLGQDDGRVFGYSAAEESRSTRTNVDRVGGGGEWAFGTALIEAPKEDGAYPEGWLFVAEKVGDTWRVALEGSPEFEESAEAAPEPVVSEEEKELFAGSNSASGERTTLAVSTRLGLPYRKGGSWRMTGGPHGWATGYDRPYSALDFAGGRGRVRSPGPGRVYKMCGNSDGWLRVIHPNGYSTDYYHLRDNIKPRDGKPIETGAFLGYTGTTTCAGGAAYGSHVHFALRQNGAYTALDNKTLGGWTFQQGNAYYGYAQHNNRRSYAGDPLRNYGR